MGMRGCACIPPDGDDWTKPWLQECDHHERLRVAVLDSEPGPVDLPDDLADQIVDAVGSPLELRVRHQPTIDGETTMGTFTTKLKLGGEAFGVSGSLDPTIQRLTVGQIRVIETLPSSRFFEHDVCYKEEYMCVETGVGGGTVWTYGKNIFATEAEAQTGVIAHQQSAYKQRAERDAYRAQQAEQQHQNDLRTLERLKQQYEAAGGLVDA